MDIQNGCGKGKKCSYSLYVQPSGMTKESFSEYVRKQEELMEDHSIPETYIEVENVK